MKTSNGIITIYKKEFNTFFYSMVAYIFLIIFISVPNILLFFFFGGIFRENMASMRAYFIMLPFVFVIFIPGLNMGAWSKEKEDGTIELLFTFPVSEIKVIIGKFLASLTIVIIALAATLFIPILIQIFLGNFDWGQLAAQYIGAIFLASSYIAITFFISSMNNEIVNSFLISAAFLLLFNILGFWVSSVPFPLGLEWFRGILVWISPVVHFSNFSKGVIDFRDLIYYIGITVIFFYLNLRSLESRKWR